MYATTGLKIATNWWPIEPKIEHWQINFQNWSPASEMQELQDNHDTTFVFYTFERKSFRSGRWRAQPSISIKVMFNITNNRRD